MPLQRLWASVPQCRAWQGPPRSQAGPCATSTSPRDRQPGCLARVSLGRVGAAVHGAEHTHASRRLRTWLQLPGAAQRSTTLRTSAVARAVHARDDGDRERGGTSRSQAPTGACRTVEDVKLLVELQQLVGAAGAPSLLLGQPVVDVAFVLGGSSHGNGPRRPRGRTTVSAADGCGQ